MQTRAGEALVHEWLREMLREIGPNVTVLLHRDAGFDRFEPQKSTQVGGRYRTRVKDDSRGGMTMLVGPVADGLPAPAWATIHDRAGVAMLAIPITSYVMPGGSVVLSVPPPGA